MDEESEFFFLNVLPEIEKGIEDKKDKSVQIENVINMKSLCDYEVSCTYSDMILIISMLHDYMRLLDDIKKDDLTYQEYYRKRFEDMANRLAEQIEYDYDAKVKKCRKKFEAAKDDVGEESMAMLMKSKIKIKGLNKRKKGEKEDEEDEEIDDEEVEEDA